MIKMNFNFRYCCHSVPYVNEGARHGIYADLMLKNGKCIIGKKPRNQLVCFEDRTLVVVPSRTLRLTKKCSKHRNVRML